MPLCPACNSDIAIADVNISQGVLLCRACGKLSSLAQAAGLTPGVAPASGSLAGVGHGAIEVNSRVDLPVPSGCAESRVGGVWRAQARARGPIGIFLLIFAAFWNLITFAALVVMLVYTGKGTPALTAEDDVPRELVEQAEREAQAAAEGNLSDDWVSVLMLTPFVFVGLGMGFAGVLLFFGRNEVRIEGTNSSVFFGVGNVGRRRRFDATRVTQITMGYSNVRVNGQPTRLITIHADRNLSFGSMLREDRAHWLAVVSRRELVQPKIDAARG